jgi:fibronectin-binding autotransporter adhesin
VKISWKAIPLIAALLGTVSTAQAQQTNYLGTVFIADPTTPTQQLKVNSDGSINATVVGGGGGITVGGAITGVCANGYVIYNNSGFIGCEVLAGGGNVSNSGTPTNGQLAQWTNATTIQGFTLGTGVATALGNTAGGAGGFALESGLSAYLPLAGGTMSGTITGSDAGTWSSNGISDGVVKATSSLAVGGATIGSNVLAVEADSQLAFAINATAGVTYNLPIAGTTPASYVINFTGETLPNVDHPASLVIAQSATLQSGSANVIYMYQWETDGSYNVLTGYTQGGTPTSPSATQGGNIILRVLARGYGADEYTGTVSAISFVGGTGASPSNWTDASTPSWIGFGTTPSGSSNPDATYVAAITPAGGLAVGAGYFSSVTQGPTLTTDPGAGNIGAKGSVGVFSGTSIPSGGTTGAGVLLSSTADFGMFFGSGAPTLSAAEGSLYLTSAGAPYYNNNGSTGWTQLVNSAVATLSSLTSVGTITTGGLGTGAVIGGVTMTLGSDATGDLYYRNSSGALARLGIGTTGQVLTVAAGLPSWAAGGSGSGTVTSVALTGISGIITISGSPITTSGTLALALATQTANYVFAGPTTGSAATPTFRALVAADIPSLSGTYLPLAGGTMSGNIAMGGGNISGGGTFTATTLAGTLSTAAQTNITSVGTLTGGTASTGFVVGGVTADFGSDAKGDTYTNGGSSNVITRLAIGTTGQCYIVASGLPSWGSCGSGSGLTVGTTTIASGASGCVLYETSGSVLGCNSQFTTNGSGTSFILIPTSTSASVSMTTGTATNSSQTLSLMNDTSAATTTLRVINSAGADTAYTNMPSTSLLLATGSATNGLAIGTFSATAPIWFFTGTTLTTDLAMEIVSPSVIEMPNLASSSAAQTGTMCYGTGGALTYDTTLGCLSSLEEMKDILGPIKNALVETVNLKPFWFTPINRPPGSDAAEQPGLGAHQVEAIDKRLVGYGPDGKLRGVRYMEMSALLTADIRELAERVCNLEPDAANDNLCLELKKVANGSSGIVNTARIAR